MLKPIDENYASRYELEPAFGRGSVSFYTRTGHAFVAIEDAVATGFVLGQAIFDGNRALLFVSRLAATDAAGIESRRALAEAVTKSAYDAGVYDVLVLLPEADRDGQVAMEQARYRRSPVQLFGRVLGSRGLAGKDG